MTVKMQKNVNIGDNCYTFGLRLDESGLWHADIAFNGKQVHSVSDTTFSNVYSIARDWCKRDVASRSKPTPPSAA